MGVAWLNPDGELASRPTSLPGVAFPSDETLESRGWRKVEVPGCDQKYWVRAGDTFREMTQDERAALAVSQAEAEAEEYTAKVAAVAPQAALFRHVLRQNFGAGAETNTAITAKAVEQYFIAKQLNGNITAADLGAATLLERGFSALKAFTGDGTSWSFPWHLIPEESP